MDWDVHHGQGTQKSFYDDPRVLYFSIHRQMLFPYDSFNLCGYGMLNNAFRYEFGTWWPELRESDFDHVGSGSGAGFNVNVPLNVVGNGDAEYIAAFTQVLMDQ